MSTLASRFCKMVSEEPEITNATARFGAWLVGVAESSGGFPIEMSYLDIRQGFVRNGQQIEGTGSRPETIRAAAKWLTDHGYLSLETGRATGFGYSSNLYTLHIG